MRQCRFGTSRVSRLLFLTSAYEDRASQYLCGSGAEHQSGFANTHSCWIWYRYTGKSFMRPARAASLLITSTPQIKDASPAPKQQTHARSSMSAFARSKQEMARRILYSKFLRGEVVTNEDIEKTPGLPARPSNALAAEAGSSTVTPSEVSVSQNAPMAFPSCQPSTTSPVTDNKETKEERRKRRAEKAAKKAAKSGKAEERQAKLESRAERKSRKLAQASSASDGESKRTLKKGKAKKRDTEVGLIAEAENHAKDRKRKRDRQETHVDTQGTDARGTEDADGKLGTKKKRKTKSGDTSAS